MEKMEIITVGAGNRLPYTAAKVASPVIGRISIYALFNIEITAVFAIGVCQRFLKPFMLIGAVIDN